MNNLATLSKLVPLLCICFFLPTTRAQAPNTSARANPKLRLELLDRLKNFETARDGYLVCAESKQPECDAAYGRILRINSENNLRLKELGGGNDWLRCDVVDYDGAAAAIGLLFYADLALKKQLLPSVRTTYNEEKTSGQYYAFLADDILCTEHKPLLYGEVSSRNGIACELADPSNVDSRRAELGMPPLGVDPVVKRRHKLGPRITIRCR